MLVQLAQRDRFTMADRVDPHDVARVITDQVTAGYPCRQPQYLTVRIRVLDATSHLIQVSAGIEGAHVVNNSGLAD